MKTKILLPFIALSLGLTASPALAGDHDHWIVIDSFSWGTVYHYMVLLVPAVQAART